MSTRRATLFALFLFCAVFAAPVFVPASQAQEGAWVWFHVDKRRVADFAFSPNFDQDRLVFAGVGTGDPEAYGLLKSSDAGLTWEQTPGFNAGIYGRRVVVSPNYPQDQTLFVVVNRRTYTPEEGPRSVLKSTDGGMSWVAAQEGINLSVATMEIWDLAISPAYADDHTLLLGMQTRGLYRTTDGGQSWQNVWNGTGTGTVSTIAFSPAFAQDKTVFVGTLGNGVLKSTDGGTTWHEVNEGVTTDYVRSSAISPNYAQDQTVFLGGDLGLLFYSSDGGSSWQAINEGIDTGAPMWSLALSRQYVENRTLYTGDEKGHVFRSTDNGSSWQDLQSPSRRSIDALAIVPAQTGEAVLAAPTGEGLWRYTFVATGSAEAATATAVAEIADSGEPAAQERVPLATPTPVLRGPSNACIAPIVLFSVLMFAVQWLRHRRPTIERADTYHQPTAGTLVSR